MHPQLWLRAGALKHKISPRISKYPMRMLRYEKGTKTVTIGFCAEPWSGRGERQMQQRQHLREARNSVPATKSLMVLRNVELRIRLFACEVSCARHLRRLVDVRLASKCGATVLCRWRWAVQRDGRNFVRQSSEEALPLICSGTGFAQYMRPERPAASISALLGAGGW